MATTFQSRPGFKPVKHLSGAPYNGQANVYVVATGNTVVPGDIVTLDAENGSAAGVMAVSIPGAATTIPVGVVVGVINAKLDPITGEMTNGSIALDTPQTGAAGAYVLVADAPDLVFQTEIATYAIANIGKNHESVLTTYNTTSGASNMKIVYNGGDQTDPWKVVGVDLVPDSISGGSGYASPVDGDSNVKVLVTANVHQYRDAGGTASV